MSALSKFTAIMFATMLSKQFKNWEAFKLGLIDEKGNLLKEPKTAKEKAALGALEDLVRKVKKVVLKFVPDNKYLNFLITAYLLKRESIENPPCEVKFSSQETRFNGELTKELSESQYDELYIILQECVKMNLHI